MQNTVWALLRSYMTGKKISEIVYYLLRIEEEGEREVALDYLNHHSDDPEIKNAILGYKRTVTLEGMFENHRRYALEDRGERFVLSGQNLSYVCFRSAQLRKAKFRECKLIGADFRSAFLKEADFSYCTAHDANFENAIMFGAELEGMKADRANFRKADLGQTSIGGGEFFEQSFKGSIFTGAAGIEERQKTELRNSGAIV